MSGSVIRSDGCGAYGGLHPRESTARITGESLVALHTENHVYIYQVVNHSVNFSTTHQAKQNNSIGGINTNIVEGMWR